MGKKALIIGAAPASSWGFLCAYRSWPELVICADGGLLSARAAGFRPDFYVGDNDSGGAPEPGVESRILPVEKDVTDLEAAVLLALEQGAEELLLTGCTGGRLDHTLSALSLLEKYDRPGRTLYLLDGKNLTVFLRSGRDYEIHPLGYRYFSLIPVSETLENLTIREAKYPLSDCLVPRGGSLTVSNEFRSGPARVRFEAGCCYLIRSE